MTMLGANDDVRDDGDDGDRLPELSTPRVYPPHLILAITRDAGHLLHNSTHMTSFYQF